MVAQTHHVMDRSGQTNYSTQTPRGRPLTGLPSTWWVRATTLSVPIIIDHWSSLGAGTYPSTCTYWRVLVSYYKHMRAPCGPRGCNVHHQGERVETRKPLTSAKLHCCVHSIRTPAAECIWKNFRTYYGSHLVCALPVALNLWTALIGHVK